MEGLINYQFSWINFLTIGMLLLIVYFLLRFASNVVGSSFIKNFTLRQLSGFINKLLTVYEPLAIIILSGVFIFINPLFHGLLVLLLLLAMSAQIRNYTSGRLVHMNKDIAPGKKLKTGEFQGIVSRLGNLGLDLKTGVSIHRISYSKLLSEGYTLISGEDIGGFYQLRISKPSNGKVLSAVTLLDLFATAPYLDWNHKPEFLPQEKEEGPVEVRVLLKDEIHLTELKQLIREWGYSCTQVQGV